jgi:hypothetical protein
VATLAGTSASSSDSLGPLSRTGRSDDITSRIAEQEPLIIAEALVETGETTVAGMTLLPIAAQDIENIQQSGYVYCSVSTQIFCNVTEQYNVCR